MGCKLLFIQFSVFVIFKRLKTGKYSITSLISASRISAIRLFLHNILAPGRNPVSFVCKLGFIGTSVYSHKEFCSLITPLTATNSEHNCEMWSSIGWMLIFVATWQW